MLLVRLICEAVRDGTEDGLLDDVAEDAQFALPVPVAVRLDDAGALDGKGGNKLLLAAFPPAFLPTVERDDWAVELFSFSTLEPPAPSTAAALLAGTPLGPGREG